MADLAYRSAAVADIDDIARFSVDRFGQEAAAFYLAGLEETIRRIAERPEIGAIVRGILPPVRSFAYRRHRIYFDFDGEVVTIVRVLHQAMNFATRLRD